MAPMEDRLREKRMRWFGHVKRISMNETLGKSDGIIVHGNARG